MSQSRKKCDVSALLHQFAFKRTYYMYVSVNFRLEPLLDENSCENCFLFFLFFIFRFLYYFIIIQQIYSIRSFKYID